MKVLLSGSTLFVVILLTAFQVRLSSCNTQKAAVITKDTEMSAAILTSHSWKPLELRAVYADDALYYRREGAENTFNYDDEYHTFNPDGTGFSLDANGYSHVIKDWYFTDETCTQLKFKYYITNSSIYVEMTWDNIRFRNNAIMTDEWWYDNYAEKNYHGQAIRIAR